MGQYRTTETRALAIQRVNVDGVGMQEQLFMSSNPVTGSEFNFAAHTVPSGATDLIAFEVAGPGSGSNSCNHHGWSYNGATGKGYYRYFQILSNDGTTLVLSGKSDYEFYNWAANPGGAADPSDRVLLRFAIVSESEFYAKLNRPTDDSDNTGTPANAGCFVDNMGLDATGHFFDPAGRP
jgi:hypothetical protein